MRKKILTISLVLLVVAFGIYRFMQLSQVTISAQDSAPVRVNVMEMQSENLSSWTFAEGTAEALRKAFLNFEQQGKVVYIGQTDGEDIIREGVRVFGPADGATHGQLLAQIDNREYASQVRALEARLQSARQRKKEAEAGKERAMNDLAQAEADFQRIEQIYERGVVSRDEYERFNTNLKNAKVAVDAADSALLAVISEAQSVAAELNSATVSLEKTSLFAPFDGIISTVNLLEGNYYYPPMGVANNREREASSAIVVLDDSVFEVRLEVPEDAFRGIEEGQTVYLAQNDRALYESVKYDFQNDAVISGKVWSVSPSASLQKRSMQVKVRAKSNNEALRDGMFVQAWIAMEERNNALVLPWEILSFHNGIPFVYVVREDKTVEMRWVSLGLQGLEKVEIIDGLKEGETVVVRGQHLLACGTQVEVLGTL